MRYNEIAERRTYYDDKHVKNIINSIDNLNIAQVKLWDKTIHSRTSIHEFLTGLNIELLTIHRMIYSYAKLCDYANMETPQGSEFLFNVVNAIQQMIHTYQYNDLNEGVDVTDEILLGFDLLVEKVKENKDQVVKIINDLSTIKNPPTILGDLIEVLPKLVEALDHLIDNLYLLLEEYS